MNMPEEVILYPSRKAWVPVLLVSLVFVAIGLYLPKDDWRRWAGLIFFGLGVVISALVICFPQCTSLRLTEEGFHMQSLFRSHLIRWDEVAEFGITHIGNEMVAFNFAAGYAKHKFGRFVVRDIAGWEGALPDTYRMSAGELGELMNAWKRRHHRIVTNS
jgi:hypothetical protein